MLSRSDMLSGAGLVGGLFVSGVGLTACKIMVKNYSKDKRFWWVEPQLLTTAALTAVTSFVTMQLGYNTYKNISSKN